MHQTAFLRKFDAGEIGYTLAEAWGTGKRHVTVSEVLADAELASA